jgi:signal transduction histidine kinase
MGKKLALMLGVTALVLSLGMARSVFASPLAASDCRAKATEACEMLAAKGEPGLEDVKAIRFGDGQGYVWVHDMDGVMVMHPIKPELDGKNVLDNTDPDGKAFFANMNELVQKNGQGWVFYKWPKPGAKDPSVKVSFVKLVKTGDKEYVCGSGIYDVTPDDIRKQYPGDALDAE